MKSKTNKKTRNWKNKKEEEMNEWRESNKQMKADELMNTKYSSKTEKPVFE